MQFANDQVGNRGRRIDNELRLVERRPHAAAESSDFNQRRIVDGYGQGRCCCSGFQPQIEADIGTAVAILVNLDGDGV